MRAAFVVLALALTSGIADAEDAVETVEDPSLHVRAVHGKIAELGVVRFDVTLDVDVPPFSSGPAATIELPATGAVTAATLVLDGTRHRLALDLASTVTERFTKLYDQPGDGVARTWGARLVDASDAVTFEVLAPGYARGTLTLSVDATGCWDAEDRVVAVPASWAPLLAGVTPVIDADTNALDEACGVTRNMGQTWVRFPSRQVANRAEGEARVDTTAARLTIGDRGLARVEIALAQELTTVPRDLYTVLLVDESRSLSREERTLQRALIEGYLRAAPRSRVQVIGYARDAQLLLPGWSVAEQAQTRIERHLRQRPLRNRSSVVRAIAAAAKALADVQGTRRVVVFTDDRSTYETIDAVSNLAAVLPKHTLAHVVSLQGSADGLVRNDAGMLAPFALATEGESMIASLDESRQIDATSLVRPTSFDNIAIGGAGWSPLVPTDWCPELAALAEGGACVWTGVGGADAGAIELTGWLWGHRVHRSIATDRRHSATLARILADNSDVPTELYEDIERIARAVNGVWSLAATWGADGGYADQQMGYGTLGMAGFGTLSHDIGDGIGAGTLRMDLEPALAAQLRPAVGACKPTHPVVVTVELTLDEIANVKVDLDPADARLEDCITEHIWATPVSFEIPNEHTDVITVI